VEPLKAACRRSSAHMTVTAGERSDSRDVRPRFYVLDDYSALPRSRRKRCGDAGSSAGDAPFFNQTAWRGGHAGIARSRQLDRAQPASGRFHLLGARTSATETRPHDHRRDRQAGAQLISRRPSVCGAWRGTSGRPPVPPRDGRGRGPGAAASVARPRRCRGRPGAIAPARTLWETSDAHRSAAVLPVFVIPQ